MCQCVCVCGGGAVTCSVRAAEASPIWVKLSSVNEYNSAAVREPGPTQGLFRDRTRPGPARFGGPETWDQSGTKFPTGLQVSKHCSKGGKKIGPPRPGGRGVFEFLVIMSYVVLCLYVHLPMYHFEPATILVVIIPYKRNVQKCPIILQALTMPFELNLRYVKVQSG